MPGKGQTSLAHITGCIVDIIHLDQLGEVLKQAGGNGNILVCVQTGIAAVLILLGLTLGLAGKTLYFVAFFLILFNELLPLL